MFATRNIVGVIVATLIAMLMTGAVAVAALPAGATDAMPVNPRIWWSGGVAE